MSECICSSCRNLKGVIVEDGSVEEYLCEFGYPSEKCADCDGSDCDESCSNYASDEEEVVKVVNCKRCGKELEMVADEDEEGEIFCTDCYLNGSK